MSPQLCPRPHTKAELGGGWRQWWYVTSVMSFYKTMASVFSVLGCSLSLITCFEESQMPCAESPWETYGETSAAKNRGFWPNLDKEMATHSSIPAWRIPWTEEPGELQSMGSQRVGHDWVRNVNTGPNTETYNHAVMEMQVHPPATTQGTWLQSQLTAWLKHRDRHWASPTQLRHSWIPDTLKPCDVTHVF